ncbi:nitrilase [Desulfosarcina sp. OttesenSCG-928-A07]|nr:nitrilase [Desulfosarcina sp. OttesenSCG-928-A07]
MMQHDIRIAAVVCRCPVGQVDRNLDRTRYWATLAREQGAALVCFPEMNLTGYSNREDICDHAISAAGPEIKSMRELARDLQVTLLVGFAEAAVSGEFYAAHMVITPQGRTGIYRKLHLAPPETDCFQAGDRLLIFEQADFRFGLQLCYDAHFPELSTAMAQAGADALFIPHASPRGTAAEKHQSWMRHLPARAYDNSVFVVACNQTGDNENGLFFPGNALALSPAGKIRDTLLTDESGLLITDLSVSQLHHTRGHRMRYFFPNRRPECYQIPVHVETLY